MRGGRRRGEKKWAAIRMGRQIEGQNNNRGENKMLALAACCKTFILSVCVSVGAAGCQVTSGQRSRRGEERLSERSNKGRNRKAKQTIRKKKTKKTTTLCFCAHLKCGTLAENTVI